MNTKGKKPTIIVTILRDGTALIDIPEGMEPDHETLERVCDIIQKRRREAVA